MVPPRLALTAARLVVVHRGARVDLDGLGRRLGCTGRRADAVLDLRRHRHESLLHVGRVLRGRLQEGDSQLIRVFLRESIDSIRMTKYATPNQLTHHGRCVVHHLLDGQITFVPYEQLVDIFASVALNLLQPLLHIVERLLVRAVVHYNDPVRAPVVRRRDRPESLLAGRVPLKWTFTD